MSHARTSWHHPKSYSEVTAVIESGHYFHKTPHGLRGQRFTAPVCGNEDVEADLMFSGHRDTFTTECVQLIRDTQFRRKAAYFTSQGRTDFVPEDVYYAVAYKGQCLGYVTYGRAVHMNPEILRQATPAITRAYVNVEYALTLLRNRPESWMFDLKGQ